MNPRATKASSLTCFLILLLLSLCHVSSGQQPTATEKPAAVAEPILTESEKRQRAFEIVWQTVNERFYDRDFAGVDWLAVRKRYEPLIASATSDTQVHNLLQEMINELHQSHFVVIPPDAIPRFAPSRKNTHSPESTSDDDSGEAEKEQETDLSLLLDKGNPELTERLSTGIGIDVRVINGAVVITRVNSGSTADRAGLRRGFVIKKANSVSFDEALGRLQSNPIWKDLLRPELGRVMLDAFINGEPGSIVRLTVVDGRNRLRIVPVVRERLSGEMSPGIGNLPPLYTEFESRILPGDVGYIRFDAFVPTMMKKVCGALRSMHNTPALIIDLRGNQGGLLGMVSGLSGLLESKVIALGVMKSRNGTSPLYAFPQRSPYTGRLAILVDGSTESAAEMFASALQEIGRAKIVGERSAGNTLPSAIIKLPTGALFQYAWASFRNTLGQPLEGIGVVPDITVKLERRRLLLGVDDQLAKAIADVRGDLRRKTLVADIETSVPPAPKESSSSGNKPTKVTIDSSPPPVAKEPTPIAKPPGLPPGANELKDVNDSPSAEEVVQRFLKVSGGEEALKKITSRLSLGTIEVPLVGLEGTVESYEVAPNKKSVIVNIRGYGIFQRTWDGAKGWVEDPVQGLIDLGGSAIARINTEADLFSLLTLTRSDGTLRLMGTLDVGKHKTFVVQATYPERVRQLWYFDVDSGLLVRRGNIYYDDYREIDGIKLPFTIRDESFSGFAAVMKFESIRNNVTIDDSKFLEYPSCFTNTNK